MNIRKTSMEELEEVLLLYQDARQFMQEHGIPISGDSRIRPVKLWSRIFAAGKLCL